MSLSPVLGSSHGGRERPVGRPAATTRRRTRVIERSSAAAVSDVDVPDFIRRASGSPREAGVPFQCGTTGDAVE